MSYYKLDEKAMNVLYEKIARFSDGREAENIINDVLYTTGSDKIKEKIHGLLPESGRTWRGKKTPAKSTEPFKKVNGNLQVEVKTKSNYNYLYFPDDGTNTIRHVGNQQFMFKGAEESSEEITNRISEKLIEKLEE